MFRRITVHRSRTKSIHPTLFTCLIILFAIIFSFFFIAIGPWRIV